MVRRWNFHLHSIRGTRDMGKDNWHRWNIEDDSNYIKITFIPHLVVVIFHNSVYNLRWFLIHLSFVWLEGVSKVIVWWCHKSWPLLRIIKLIHLYSVNIRNFVLNYWLSGQSHLCMYIHFVISRYEFSVAKKNIRIWTNDSWTKGNIDVVQTSIVHFSCSIKSKRYTRWCG